jgi:hypothetical protein
MACSQEFRLELTPEKLTFAGVSEEELVKGDFILDLVRKEILPKGMLAELPIRAVRVVRALKTEEERKIRLSRC